MYHVSDIFMDYLIQSSQQPYAVDIISDFSDEEMGVERLGTCHPAGQLQRGTVTQFCLVSIYLMLSSTALPEFSGENINF